MNYEDLRDKVVHVVFRSKMLIDDTEVASIVGTCGGVTPQLFAINDIKKVFGHNDVDLTEKLKLKGKAGMFPTRRVGFVFLATD
jgi:hypothetical protein